MASPFIYQSTGGTSGARLAASVPSYLSGKVWFVGPGGSDAAAPRGLDRKRPLATLAQAYTNAAAGDVIVCLSGHAESLGAAQTLAKAGVHIISEGTGSQRARFTCTAAVAMFDITAAGVVLDNLYFPASTSAPTARVRIAAVGCEVNNCNFDSGASDTAAALRFVTGAGECSVTGSYFVSTATAVTAQPNAGIEVANAMSDLTLDECRFDGGTYGWSSYAFLGTAAITRLTTYSLELLNSSRFIVATGSVYKINLSSASMATFLELTA